MRICRYLWLFFCLTSFVHAETIPATPVPSETVYAVKGDAGYIGPYVPWSQFPDAAQAYCTFRDSRAIASNVGTDAFRCGPIGSFGYTYTFGVASRCDGQSINGQCIKYSCPDSTWELSGQTCTKPESCPSGQREWNGECRPECDAMQTVNSETGNCECSSMRKPIPSPSVSGPGATPETTCYGGCSYKLGDMALNLGGKEWFSDLGQPTGQTCSAGQGESEKPLPETKEPPCAPGEGVGTSSSGKVLCVPEGTPNAPIPDVQKTVKKETYPDGSEKTTETTKTKDPSTGATDTKSTSTSTGGMAGPAGTTTTTETSTGDGKGTGNEPGQGDGDGDCEGDDCGGGEGFKGPEGDLYEKKGRTMRDALEDFSAAVSDAPVMVAARNWFSIGGMPASCGGLSVTVPYLDTTISADSIFCGEYGVLIMQIAGAVVLAAAAYAGFRIAIL